MTEKSHDDVDAPETVRREGPWKLIIIVAVLTAIGVWLVPSNDEAPAVATTAEDKGPDTAAPSLLGDSATREEQAEATTPESTSTEADVVVEETSAESAPPPTYDRPGDMARALIAEARKSGSVDLEALYSQAREAQADGRLADAYLLYFFGSRFGHAESALQLGTQADPATRDPETSVFQAADITQAHKWYQVAAQYGSTDGEARLSDLRARVEQMAADGDPRAQRTILLWR